jgi:hypothetical protein
MAIELEIRDGSPHWYLSPDVWTVTSPGDTAESQPIAGTPCYLMAKVRNNGTTSVTNATVRFYWGNPAIGVDRNTATLIGQSFVSLATGQVEDVLCLTPWIPEYLNEGHECILAEAFHSNDPLPATTDFNVPTDRHVAQKNLSVLIAMRSMFHMNFEMHNGSRKKREFTARVEQVKIDRIIKQFPAIQKQIEGKKEGVLSSVEFTNTRCIDPDSILEGTKANIESKEVITLEGFQKKQMAITGKVKGDFVFIVVTQVSEKTETGGLGILIINHLKKIK